jgi:hypothetical protein
MSGEFRRIYPKSGGRIFFDGGKNSKFERSIIPDNESPDCLNVVFSNGGVETRQGYDKFNSNAVGSFVFDGLYTRHDNDGSSETMVAWANGTAYIWETNTFSTVGSAQSVYTAGERVASTEYQDHIFFSNGGSTPYKYNGTDFTRHGVYQPASNATVATAATGTALTGDYSYKILYVNSASVEGDYSTETISITLSGQNAHLTSIPVAPQSWGVNARRIYRTVTSGATYLRVTELSDNTTTSYEDAVLDASLGAEAPSDNGVPPNYDTCVYHQNRIFCNDTSNPNYVWYSDLNEPYTYQSTNFIRVGDASGDLVRGIGVYDNNVVVYCERSVWIIYMPDTTASNWEPIRTKAPYGSKSQFCILDYENRQLFAAIENQKFVGFASLLGGTVEPDATLLTVQAAGSSLQTYRIQDEMDLIQTTYLGNISGIIYKNKAWIAVTYDSGNTTNNRVYTMDFGISNLSKNQRTAWVPNTGINAAQFTILDGKLYFASSTANGFIYQLESGSYNDDSSAIDSYYWTKEFSGFDNEVNFHKDFRYANILVEMVGAWSMNVTYRADSDKGDGTTDTISLDGGGSLWGVMEWGTDAWGGGSAQQDVRFLLGTLAGKRLQLKFDNQNTADQNFKVHGMNFTYNIRGVR